MDGYLKEGGHFKIVSVMTSYGPEGCEVYGSVDLRSRRRSVFHFVEVIEESLRRRSVGKTSVEISSLKILLSETTPLNVNLLHNH